MHAATKLFGVMLTLALLVGATGLAVQRGDRALMVSPPDAVLEGFVREVVMKRYPRAEEYLQQRVPEDQLRALADEIEAKVGDPIVFDAKTITRDEHDARATIRLAAGKRSESLSYALVFEDEWKIVLH